MTPAGPFATAWITLLIERKGFAALRSRTSEARVALRDRSGDPIRRAASHTVMKHAAMRPRERGSRTSCGEAPESTRTARRRIATACALGCAASALVGAHAARADGLTDDDLWRYRSSGVAIDAGVVAALPAALETGLAKGVGAGLAVGRELFWGARASWATATETAIGWQVTHDDMKLRLVGGARTTAGRGSFAVRLGAGGTLVHETRERIRGDIAGAQGSLRETAANVLLPAADLDGVVSLHVTRGWMMIVSAGPSLTRVDHKLQTGWNSYLGVAWQL
jgi:hypothetical protein